MRRSMHNNANGLIRWILVILLFLLVQFQSIYTYADSDVITSEDVGLIKNDVGDLKSNFQQTNLIDETSINFPETGVYYKTNGGQAGNNASIGTGFVAVTPGETLYFKLAEHTSFATICFYTTNNASSFLSAVIGESSTLTYIESSVEVPANANYIRACSWDDRSDCYLRKGSVINVQELKSDVETNTENILLLGEEIDSVSENISDKRVRS